MVVFDTRDPGSYDAVRGKVLVDADTGERVSSRFCVAWCAIDAPPTWPDGLTGALGYYVDPDTHRRLDPTHEADVGLVRDNRVACPVHVLHAELALVAPEEARG